MSTTQGHLLISDIKDNVLILKNGGGAIILQVSAVNFGLLSDREQMAIIFSFAQMLNSLSFSIQIVIYSERLNISSYLYLLDKAKQSQTNPLLSSMIGSYRQFIQNTIKENEVLDKKFFLVIPLFPFELGLRSSKENLERKIKTVLLPRQDQVIRQLQRVGLKATQLSYHKLIELFYAIYNGQLENTLQPVRRQVIPVNLNQPKPIIVMPKPELKTASLSTPPATGASTVVATTPINAPQIAQVARNHPFVVEELDEKI